MRCGLVPALCFEDVLGILTDVGSLSWGQSLGGATPSGAVLVKTIVALQPLQS